MKFCGVSYRLEGDVLVTLEVPRFVDDPHATGVDPANDLETRRAWKVVSVRLHADGPYRAPLGHDSEIVLTLENRTGTDLDAVTLDLIGPEAWAIALMVVPEHGQITMPPERNDPLAIGAIKSE